MDKRKIILLLVAGVCLVAAVAFLILQNRTEPLPPAGPSIQAEIEADPKLKKDFEKAEEIEQRQIKNTTPAGS
jgi:hypothetical protein